MAVLATTEFPPPGYGGIERYMVRIAGEIAAAGHPLTVVAPEMPGSVEFDRTLPYRVIRFKFPGHDNPEALPVWSYRVREKVIEAHRDMPDKCTIASSWLRSGLACATLPKSLRGSLAIVAHGSEILSQRSLPRRTVMQMVFHRADVAVANSSFTKRLLVEAEIQTPVVVSRCGIDPAPLRRDPASVPTILSVGRLVRRKGFDLMIEALPALVERFPDLRYEIVGIGPDGEAFRARVRELGLDRHVAFLGDITDEELQRAYARAWCFALPTRRVGTGDVEGFGIVYLEAAMAGIPSIGGLNSGAEDAIADGKSGLLVDGSDTTAIGLAVGYLLADCNRARAIGQYGRNRALSEFTWRLTADTIMRSLGREPLEKACSA